ncbi:MAG: acyltransferase family protein, partial [Novosphingobium sp.]|nr:acyltransferase family protein [Novosphingobium sp.]
LARHGDCIGQPIPEGRFELVDPDSGAPAADAGELVYIGPNVMMGYAEARADLARGFDIDRLMTGDLAERAAPGIYRITGRKSRFLKLFGLRIALDEVEREAARRGWTVVATGDDSRVVLASEDGRDPAPLAGELADHFNLPPQRIVALKLDSLPRLGNGKVDYRAIVAMAPAADALAPGADPVAAYAAMLARLARKPAVADSASFQTFGGDSLNYVEASILLEEALGEVPEGWESMSLGQIKALAKDAPAPLATPGDAARSQRDTHYIHAMRSIAILLVVAAHSRQVLADLSGGLDYLSFRHVNGRVVFGAGYLFQYLLRGFNYQAYVKVKLQTVIVPYLIVSIPVICIYLLGLKDVAELNAPPWVQGKLALTAFMLLTGTHLAPLWFIPMISLVYLMAPLLRMMDQRPALYALIVPLMLLGFSIGRPEQDDNPIEALAFYLPVYLIGMAACHYRAQVLPALAKVWPVLVLLVVVPVLLPGGASAHDNLNLLAKVSLSLGVIGALSVHSRKIPAWFDKIGELSFGIYFVHGYFASGFAMAARKMHVELHGILALLAVFVVILLASIAVVLVTKAIFGRYSRQIIGA